MNGRPAAWYVLIANVHIGPHLVDMSSGVPVSQQEVLQLSNGWCFIGAELLKSRPSIKIDINLYFHLWM